MMRDIYQRQTVMYVRKYLNLGEIGIWIITIQRERYDMSYVTIVIATIIGLKY